MNNWHGRRVCGEGLRLLPREDHYPNRVVALRQPYGNPRVGFAVGLRYKLGPRPSPTHGGTAANNGQSFLHEGVRGFKQQRCS